MEVGLTEVLKLTADLTAERLYYPLIEPIPDTETVSVVVEEAPATESVEATSDGADDADDTEEYVFSQAPIDWHWLTTAEIDIALAAVELQLQEAVFENLQMNINSSAGQLALESIHCQSRFGWF